MQLSVPLAIGSKTSIIRQKDYDFLQDFFVSLQYDEKKQRMARSDDEKEMVAR